MWRLDADTIKKINSYPKEKSNTEIWQELWINRHTVGIYRREIAETLKDKISKRDKKKLQLLEHYTDKDIQEMLSYLAQNTKREVTETLGEDGYLKFWLLSDSHLWAKQAALDELWEFYDRAKDKGVECFVHCWDLVDWSWVYSWQQFEQSEVWFNDQLELVKNKYPNVWLPTYFIGGNHSESYLKWGWADIAKAIETVRKDLINLWFYDATIKINWITIQLRHWGGGSSYALDYKLNKFIDKIPAWKEPDIFALWHYHQALYALHRDIHWFLPWSFLKENMLSKRFQLWNTVWGWIVEIEKDTKWRSKINMEYIKF
jgi:hypothetical protein